MGARGLGVFIIILISAAFILTSYEVAGANSIGDLHDHGRKLTSIFGAIGRGAEIIGEVGSNSKGLTGTAHELPKIKVQPFDRPQTNLYGGASGAAGKIGETRSQSEALIGKGRKIYKATKPYRKGMKLFCKLNSWYCCDSDGNQSSDPSCGMLCCILNISNDVKSFANQCGTSPTQYECCAPDLYNQCQKGHCLLCDEHGWVPSASPPAD